MATTLATSTTRFPYFSGIRANTWVKLLEPPSPYSFNKALLLYRFCFKEWIAWIPNYGEIRLNENEFYTLN
jgi:hypothetical protein